MRAKAFQQFITIALFSLIPTLLLWLPFLFGLKSFWNIPLPEGGMSTIIANYDGPLYIVIAKTFYNLEAIKEQFSFPLPVEYYAAHFPLFPFLVRLFSVVIGYPYALISVTVVSAIFALYFFFLFASNHMQRQKAYLLTLVFALLPARWLIVRSIGSPEPLFLAALIGSIYYFDQKKFLAAGVLGALAQLTKSPGILLFVAYLAAIFIPTLKSVATATFTKWPRLLNFKQTWPIFLIPLSLLGVFLLYKLTFNDFLAYFHSGDNIHLLFPPFQIFNYSAPWVGTFWLEEVLFVYLFAALGILKLLKDKHHTVAWFVIVYFVSLLFVSHRDIIRYGLPMAPFLLFAYSKKLTSKDFQKVLALLVIPIYLFSLAFIAQNVMPISDWAPFL